MTTQTEAQHYPNHDAEALGQDYINHISAMTTEGLRAKSSIAIQLAWRDVEIRRLESANAELLEDASRYRWLREQHWNDNKLGVVVRPKDKVKLGSLMPSGSLLDSVVDHMMGAAIKKHGGAA